MERHFSTGVFTIVALMAAHRTSSESCASAVYSQEEVRRAFTYLQGFEPIRSRGRLSGYDQVGPGGRTSGRVGRQML